MANIDLTVGLRIIAALTGENYEKIYNDLYLKYSSNYNRFKDGYGSGKYTKHQWAHTDDWRANLPLEVKEAWDKEAKKQKFPGKNLNEITFESKLYDVMHISLDTCAEDFGEDTTCSIVLEVCNRLRINSNYIKKIEQYKNSNTFPELADYLTREIIRNTNPDVTADKTTQWSISGKPKIPKRRELLEELENKRRTIRTTQTEPLELPVTSETTVEPACKTYLLSNEASFSAACEETQITKSVELLTYDQLIARGLTARMIADNLVENDYRLYPDIAPENEADAAHWATFLHEYPQTFRYLVDSNNRIVGNWSIMPLTADQHAEMVDGRLLEAFIGIEDIPALYRPGEYILYILNLSINDEGGLRTVQNYNLLFDSLFEQLYQYAEDGIFFGELVHCVHSKRDEALFRQYGFKYRTDNIKSGKVYRLPMNPFPKTIEDERLRRRYETHTWLRFEQLSDISVNLLTHMDLERISELVFDTDPFIYPALFCSREQAVRVLPQLLLRGKDPMFRLKNIYIARLGQEIVGLVLWHRGPMLWDGKEFQNVFSDLKEPPSPHFELVKDRYFASYSSVEASVTSLINFAVYKTRQRTGIGGAMMSEFVKQHSNEVLELFALHDNAPALRLYSRNDFLIERTCQGFCIDQRVNLPCLQMIRRPYGKT